MRPRPEEISSVEEGIDVEKLLAETAPGEVNPVLAAAYLEDDIAKETIERLISAQLDDGNNYQADAIAQAAAVPLAEYKRLVEESERFKKVAA